MNRIDVLRVWYGEPEDESTTEHLLATRYGDPWNFFLLSCLMLPQTIVFCGRVFLSFPRAGFEPPRESFISMLTTKNPNGDWKPGELEGYNWITLSDHMNYGPLDPKRLPPSRSEELRVEMWWQLAETVAQSWRAWLAYCHPQRKFEVFVMDDEETGNGPGVGFREI